MKDTKYISQLKEVALADIQNGNRERVEAYKQKLIEREDYESCEAIQQALNQQEEKQ